MSLVLAISINVIYVPGPHSLTPTEVNDLLLNVKSIYDTEFPNKPVKIEFGGVHYDTPKREYTIANSVEAYRDWRSSLQASKGNFLVILPPTTNRFIVGYATPGCHKGNFNSTIVALLQSKNQSGQNRQNEDAYLAAHEIGHILNASHRDSETIMHAAPLPFVNKYGALPFDPASKRDIRRCVD